MSQLKNKMNKITDLKKIKKQKLHFNSNLLSLAF